MPRAAWRDDRDEVTDGEGWIVSQRGLPRVSGDFGDADQALRADGCRDTGDARVSSVFYARDPAVACSATVMTRG